MQLISTPGRCAWVCDPGAALTLVIVGVLYLGGVRRVRMRGGSISVGRHLLFTTGWGMVAVALVSPLHAWSDHLLSAHMTQHALLVLAPLPLALAATVTRLLQALAPSARGRLVRMVRLWQRRWLPWWAALTLMVGTVLIWHLPSVFDVAASNDLIHGIEHMSLVTVASAFWGMVVGNASRRSGQGPALLSVFVLFLGGAGLGTLLAFSGVPWYVSYVARAREVGVDWAVDQQLAGVVMSVPMGVVLMAVAARLGWKWAGGAPLGAEPNVQARSASAATAAKRRAR